MARLRLSRLSVAETGAARRFFLLAAPPLTVLAEPVDLRLGFCAGTCGQRLNTSFAGIFMTQEKAEINFKNKHCDWIRLGLKGRVAALCKLSGICRATRSKNPPGLFPSAESR